MIPYIRKELIDHKLAYTLLIVGLIVGLLLFMAAWPYRDLQRITAVALGIFYAFWGVVTHLKANHITKQVIYEYVGIGTLGAIILILVTL